MNNFLSKITDVLTLEIVNRHYKKQIRDLEQLKRNEIDAASGFKPTLMKGDEELVIFMSAAELEKKDRALRDELALLDELEKDKDEHGRAMKASQMQHLNKAADIRSAQLDTAMKIANLKLIQVLAAFVLLSFFFTFIDFYIPSLGSNIKSDYYATVAQIIPVLLIACFFSPNDEESASWRRFWLFAKNKSSGTIAAAYGEFACLSALAIGRSSTFLLLTSASSIGILFYITLRHLMGATRKIQM